MTGLENNDIRSKIGVPECLRENGKETEMLWVLYEDVGREVTLAGGQGRGRPRTTLMDCVGEEMA